MLWFWGLAGAFIFAGPRLNADIKQARSTVPRGSVVMCIWEFFVALAIGAIAAAAATEAIAEFLHRSSVGDLRGIATLLGLGANHWAPKVVKALGGKIDRVGKGEKL